MKLLAYSTGGEPLLGAVYREWVINLGAASRGMGTTSPSRPLLNDLRSFLSNVPQANQRAKEVFEHAVEKGEYHHKLAEILILPPVPSSAKFIGIGLNYRGHAEEQNARVPANPIIFAKFSNSIIGPFDGIRYPSSTRQLDFEAELGVIIGRRGRDIPQASASEYIAGYTVINDVTARDLQLSDRQWVRGKTLDSTTPIGPYLVTADEVDCSDLGISLLLNDLVMQKSTTADLIFTVPELVSFVSQDITLEPGDIIATGTPAGVGFARKPPVYLERGDKVVVEIRNVGRLENVVV